MKDGESLSAALGTDSELPHRSRDGCNFSLAERQQSSRDAFSQELTHLNGPNFHGINLLLIIQDTVFWNVGGNFFRFRQRTDPLIIIELFRGWFFTFFKNIICVLRRKRPSFGKSPVAHLIVRMSRPRNRRLHKPAPATETMGSNMFLPFTCWLQSTHGRQFDVRDRRDTCLAAALFPHRALALLCTFHHHSKQSAPPRHSLRWCGECRCPNSVAALWSSSLGSRPSLALLHPRVPSWLC